MSLKLLAQYRYCLSSGQNGYERETENFALYILLRVTDRSDLNRIADFDPTRNTLLARSLDVQNVKII